MAAKVTAARVRELDYAHRNEFGMNRMISGVRNGTPRSVWRKMMEAMCADGLFTEDRFGDFTITPKGRSVLAAWREKHPTRGRTEAAGD